MTTSWVFLGQNEMGGAALAALVDSLSPPTIVLTRRPKRHANAVVGVAQQHGLRLIELDDLNGRLDVLSDVERSNACAGVCAGWSQRLGHAALTALPAWYNLHPSLLPAWRGSDPIGWQLATGATEVGCSVHRMTARVDEGPVVASGSIAVEWDDPGFDALVARQRCGHLLGQLTAAVLAGGHKPPSEGRQKPSNCPPRGVVPLLQPAELTAAVATRLVRSFSPFPGVGVTGLGEQRAVRAWPMTVEKPGRPGDVSFDGCRAQVRCRDRWIEVQLMDWVDE